MRHPLAVCYGYGNLAAALLAEAFEALRHQQLVLLLVARLRLRSPNHGLG